MGDLAKLEEFERAVYGRKREDRLAENGVALNALLQCLWPLREGSHFEGHDLSTARSDFTRMASAITALFCEPGFRLTREGFDQLVGNKSVIETIFKASAFETSDHVFRLIEEDAEYVNKYLVLFPMDSALDLDLEAAFRCDPDGMLGLYLSMLGFPHVFTEKADARREKLLGLAPIFENVSPNVCLYNALCGAYMHVSYAHGHNKHEPKRVFHKLLAGMVSPHVEQKQYGLQLRKERPTIVVVFEWWHSSHAMYRSYARSIEQLKRDFRVVGMCPGTTADEKSKELFDDWIDFDASQMVLAEVAKKIQAAEPDIVYYPSVGMAVWVIAMASLRLAPIQVMTYGHPATTNSAEIDYGLIEADCCVPSRFSEKMVTLPDNTVRPVPLQRATVKHAPKRTDVIRIGVAAMQVKVTWPFIRALMRVQELAEKKVEVWFFSAVHGVGMYAFVNELEKMIANVTVQERQTYPDYMAQLAQCDICLFSFPFGGANSMYDAMELGLPMVSLEGEEPHSRSDASIIRRAGLPESLIAKTEEEYVQIILSLLDDDTRIAIAQQVAAVDMDGKFFAADDSHAFVDAFTNIYRCNTVVQIPEFPIFVKEAETA